MNDLKCINCGTICGKKDKFCPNCGQEIIKPTEQSFQATPDELHKPTKDKIQKETGYTFKRPKHDRGIMRFFKKIGKNIFHYILGIITIVIIVLILSLF